MGVCFGPLPARYWAPSGRLRKIVRYNLSSVRRSYRRVESVLAAKATGGPLPEKYNLISDALKLLASLFADSGVELVMLINDRLKIIEYLGRREPHHVPRISKQSPEAS